MKKFGEKIIKENPIFVSVLGLCPALGITTKFENAYVMGLAVLIVLIFSNLIISLIKKLVTKQVRIPVYILVIATFVTIVELLISAYLPNLYHVLGIYLPLLTVNCIILGRALAVASKEKVGTSLIDALTTGIGFTLALMLIAIIREVIGTNTITIMDSVSSLTGYRMVYQIMPPNNLIPLSLFTSPAGAFLTLGGLMAIFNYWKNKRGNKNESV